MWLCCVVASAGSAWMAVCQGSADAVLVPMLLDAARQAGSATDVAALTAAKQALAGDRNIALDELAKVCGSGISLAWALCILAWLPQCPTVPAFRASLCHFFCSGCLWRSGVCVDSTDAEGFVASIPCQVRSLVAELLGHLAPLDSSAAACSDTVGPGQSLSHSQWPSSAASSDELLLPAEYERVMAQLKKRNEKGHMILALKEVRTGCLPPLNCLG